MVGHHVVAHARKTGHEVAVLTPSSGLELRRGAGLADALQDARSGWAAGGGPGGSCPRVRAAPGEAITVHPDADSVAGIPPRSLLPQNGARIQGPRFRQSLASDDVAALTV